MSVAAGAGQASGPSLADRIDAELPQTQCTRCGYPDCRSYAEAIAEGRCAINRCPPGGAEGIRRLSAVTGLPELPLDPACGAEGPRRVARIDEAWCIGCTLCIKACPVDCIIGAPKALHAVIVGDCTGCDLCAPACPVDCIEMVRTDKPGTGWAAWSVEQAEGARRAYQERSLRRARLEAERADEREAAARDKLQNLEASTIGSGADDLQRKRAVVQAALERARRARAAQGESGP